MDVFKDAVSLSCLASPTECFVIPEARQQEQKQIFDQFSLHKLWYKPVNVLSSGRYLEYNNAHPVKSEDGSTLFVSDSIVWQQGPNYSFAKLVHRWRSVCAFEQGHVISSNLAPASLTQSVLHNPLVAAGMLGCEQ